MLNPAQAPAIADLYELYRRRVPRMFHDYCETGSYTTSTFVDNSAAFAKYKLRQRVAVNIDNRSTATEMIGEKVAMPVALAPVGLTGMQHADGEILACRAAQKFGVPYILTTMSICSLEDVAAHNDKPFWFQLYVMRERGFSADLVARAKAANCSALVLTLDLQVLGQRHKDIKNGLSAPPKLTLANIANMMTKPRWGLGMLGTKRRFFRQHRRPREGRDRHGVAGGMDQPPVRPNARLVVGGIHPQAVGRKAHPQGHQRCR